MLHPALVEVMARDRMTELQRAGAKRSFGTRSHVVADRTESRTAGVSIRHSRRASPRRAIGWFLVSVGLRLAVPPARPRSVR
jgi:hypothetical protein